MRVLASGLLKLKGRGSGAVFCANCTNMKIRQRKLLFAFLVLIGVFGSIVALLVRPGVMQSTSPDARIVARVTIPNVLSRLKVRDETWIKKTRVHLHVTDTQTGERVTAYEHGLPNPIWPGGLNPKRLVWSSDGKQLTYEFILERGKGNWVMGKTVMALKVNPLQVRVLEIDPYWLAPQA